MIERLEGKKKSWVSLIASVSNILSNQDPAYC